MDYHILNHIQSPDDVKALGREQLDTLCDEIRDCIVQTVAKNGGHLASNLGSVELTVALHRAFSSPRDAILFDVGHQSYTHKLLTGRFARFSTIRTEGGLSGFMRPDESEHDPFVTGHSSNSISAAYGIYKAKRLSGEDGTAVAVIGDGAMTGGMAYEALNNAGSGRSNFIVVLNDNKMSISRNVGAMARAFTQLRNQPRYHHFKFALNKILFAIPVIGVPIYHGLVKIKDGMKNLVYHNNIFVGLGFNYLGPVDGHNIAAMEALFRIAQTYARPSLVHVVTTKGKGYAYAESSPRNYHGVSPFDVDTGTAPQGKVTYSDVAGQTLCTLAAQNERICAITAAMSSGTGLLDFSSRFKNRFFDVGIAEQHAVTFSAGLAKGGMIPFFVVYSSFLQRGYDQILHDAAIAHLPLKLLVDRAGIVGEDGESHQGIFDAAFLTTVPGITVYSPSYYTELQARIAETAVNDAFCAIRYPRGCEKEPVALDFSGDYTVVGTGGKTALVTYGRLFSNALEAKADLPDTDIVKLNKIFPIEDNLIRLLQGYDAVYFFEEGVRSGGIAEHIGARLLDVDFGGKYRITAIPDCFVPAAEVSDAIRHYGLDSLSMKKTINAREL